jgi:hypothetical protein
MGFDDLFVPDVRLGFGSYQVSEEILGNTVLSQHTHTYLFSSCIGDYEFAYQYFSLNESAAKL